MARHQRAQPDDSPGLVIDLLSPLWSWAWQAQSSLSKAMNTDHTYWTVPHEAGEQNSWIHESMNPSEFRKQTRSHRQNWVHTRQRSPTCEDGKWDAHDLSWRNPLSKGTESVIRQRKKSRCMTCPALFSTNHQPTSAGLIAFSDCIECSVVYQAPQIVLSSRIPNDRAEVRVHDCCTCRHFFRCCVCLSGIEPFFPEKALLFGSLNPISPIIPAMNAQRKGITESQDKTTRVRWFVTGFQNPAPFCFSFAFIAHIRGLNSQTSKRRNLMYLNCTAINAR